MRDAPAPAAGRAAPAAQNPVPWFVGERLDYRLKFGFFNVGNATLEVLGIDSIRGVPCYHVLFTINGHVGLFGYSLLDSLQSWFGVQDMVSRRFWQDTNEKGHLRKRHYEIYPERGMWVRNDTDSGVTVADPLDDASFFFFARTQTFDDDRVHVYARYFMADINPVTLRRLGRENAGVPAGRFPTVVVRPTFKSGGMFGENGQAAIWFSEDDARLPIRIRASTPIGTLEMALTARN